MFEISNIVTIDMLKLLTLLFLIFQVILFERFVMKSNIQKSSIFLKNITNKMTNMNQSLLFIECCDD